MSGIVREPAADTPEDIARTRSRIAGTGRLSGWFNGKRSARDDAPPQGEAHSSKEDAFMNAVVDRRSLVAAVPAIVPAAAAVVVALPALGAPAEEPYARVDRLMAELAEALDKTRGSKFGAIVYPASTDDGDILFNIRAWRAEQVKNVEARREQEQLASMSPKQRMSHHAAGYKQAGLEMCPEATEWWTGYGLYEGPGAMKFQITGSIPRPRGWKPATEAVSPDLAALIGEHKAAWKALDTSSYLDAIHPTPFQGRQHRRLYRRYDKVTRKLMRHPCRTLADRRAKVAHLSRHPDMADYLATFENGLAALLRSLVGEV